MKKHFKKKGKKVKACEAILSSSDSDSSSDEDTKIDPNMCFFAKVCEKEVCDNLHENTRSDSHELSHMVSSSHSSSHMASSYDSCDTSSFYDSSHDYTSHDYDPISHLVYPCDAMSTYDSIFLCQPISLSDPTSSSGSSDSHHLRFKLNDFYHHYWCNHQIRRKSF